MAAKTNEQFITDSKALHGELKYDYSECVYIGAHKKVKLRCIEHNHKFEVKPNNHLSKGVGCTKCTGLYVPTTEEFISRSKALHGESKYDYSECVYKNNHDKVRLRCVRHNHKFDITPSSHVRGDGGCTKCANTYAPTTGEFITRSKEVHGESKYDYGDCVYIGAHKKVKLRCIEHNHKFEVTPDAHTTLGIGCTKCAGHYVPTTNEFIAKSKELHGELKYDYSECVYIGAHKKVKLRCIAHNHRFEVKPGVHIYRLIGCTKCAQNYIPTTAEWITISKELHGGTKYDYSSCIYGGAHKKVKLRCIEHNHEFEVTPDAHTSKGVGCIKCTSAGFSKKQGEYFGYLMLGAPDLIQHKHNGGEFKIPNIGKVDGYCEKTNTIYEFHGTFWHGHPSKYDPTDTHPLNYKTYGELHQKTLERDQKIRDLGYNLVVMWEHEWDTIAKENKTQRTNYKSQDIQ